MSQGKIIFVPTVSNLHCCAYKKYNLIKSQSFLFARWRYKLIKGSSPLYSKITSYFKKSIVFGYPTEDFEYIKAMSGNLHPAWFSDKIKLGVFFMPDGSKLFAHPNWRLQFDNYIIFKNKYEYLVDDLPIMEAETPKIYKKIFQTIYAENDPNKVVENIKLIYTDYVLRLFRQIEQNKNINPDDLLMFIHKLHLNINNITIILNED